MAERLAKPLRQQTGKDWRHVLHYDNRHRKVVGDQRQDLRQRIRATGRSANRHNFDAWIASCSQLDR